jgi:Raf kinase inhibitor-like YbhB/YbcL family protein
MKLLLFVFSFTLSQVALAAPFTLTSADLPANKPLANKFVFNSFGCAGENKSPALEWKNAPAGTKSFAVTVYDPDAPTGSGWWHWTIFNIPAKTTKLAENASQDAKLLPAGAVQGRTDFGKSGYGGACPPQGDKPHHYIFTVYALKSEKLDLNQDSPGAMVGFYLRDALAKASITVTYGR